MTAPNPTLLRSRSTSPSAREGRDWTVTCDQIGTVTHWGRLKLEDHWLMIVDSDEDGVGFVVFGAPKEAVLSVTAGEP